MSEVKHSTGSIVLGGFGLAFAVIGFFVPIVGPNIMAPVGAVLSSLGVYLGYKGGPAKGLGIAVMVVNLVNFVISPTWRAARTEVETMMGPVSGLITIGILIVSFFMAGNRLKKKTKKK